MQEKGTTEEITSDPENERTQLVAKLRAKKLAEASTL
jgi:hypothetical protein